MRGRYKKGLTSEEKEAELEERRAELAPPAQKVYEEFRQEGLESQTEFLPSKSNETRFHLKDLLVMLDELIEKGELVSYKDYVLYWRRYMAFTKAVCLTRAIRKHKADANYSKALLQEHRDYFLEGHVAHRPKYADDQEARSEMQKARKKAYHEQARVLKNEQGDVIGGATLVYQRK